MYFTYFFLGKKFLFDLLLLNVPTFFFFFWKTEHQRIDAFELWCWRRLLRVPRMVRSSSQSILKEINLEYLLEGLTLKLKLQYLATSM